jgi:FMN-dependent NADH-azoreductase
MGFLGVTDVTVIRAEGLAFGPDARSRPSNARSRSSSS